MVKLCKQCGSDNPPHLRVCAQCAAPLANLCPNCGFENPTGFKFCGDCGSPLLKVTFATGRTDAMLNRMRSHMPSNLADKISRVGRQLEGERRNVTILFSDVVGFTTLSEKLDPEQVFHIIEQMQQAFLAEIYAHEGWFDKFLGDGLMAIFGAPIAHEDDAARAVRAALGFQSALQHVNEELDPRLNIHLRVRVGLNSGTVVVATMGSDMNMNYTPLGDVVNVASRLQTLAEPGSIVISRSVYDQVKPLFTFHERGWVQVKGRVEPVEIFQVTGAHTIPSRARGIAGLNAPMVGRAHELAQLTQLHEPWLHGADGRLVLVSGEAGIGKSRLMAEFKQTLAAQPITIVEGVCLAYGQAPYEVFRQHLMQLALITPSDDAPTMRDKLTRYLEALLGHTDECEQALTYLAYVLSIPLNETSHADRIRHLEPAQLRQQVFLTVREVLLAQAQRQPLMLIFEDLHWIDHSSLDLLLFLANSLANVRLLLYGSIRPTPEQTFKQLEQLGRERLGARYIHLPLTRLSPDDSVTLLAHLLTVSDLPTTLKQIILERAEGNPLYLEELLRMLINRGLLHQTTHQWQLASEVNLNTLQAPRTLQDLIMARVDNLDAAARYSLQCAAVIGKLFTLSLLRYIVDTTQTDIEKSLQMLCANELLIASGSQPEPTFTFHHVIIQETVYASLLQRRRERLHHKIAEGIEQLYREQLSDHIEQLAYHYQQSQDMTKALPYLIQAGERATRRYANDEALALYRTALAALNTAATTPLQRIAVHGGMYDALNVLGHYDSALQSCRNALEIARSIDPAPIRLISELARKLGRLHERKGDYAEAMRWLDTALEELSRDPDSTRSIEMVRLHLERGWVYYRRGDLDKAQQARMQVLALSEGTDYYMEMGSAYNGLVPLFWAKGDWANALAYGEKGLALREKIGDMEGAARSYLNLGTIAGLQGEWQKAIEYNERALSQARRIQLTSTITTALNNLGYMHTVRGQTQLARANLQEALRISEQSGDVHQSCVTLNNLVRAALLEQNLQEAQTTLARSLKLATETGNKSDLAETYWLIAEAHWQNNDLAAAYQAAYQALTIAKKAQLKLYEGRACRVLGHVLCAQHDLNQAETLLTRAGDIFTQLNNRYEIAHNHRVVARLRFLQSNHGAANREAQLALAIFGDLGAAADQQHTRALLQEIQNGRPHTASS